jgi:hypothetical protein
MLPSCDIPRSGVWNLNFLFSESRMIFFSFYGFGSVISDLSARRPSRATTKDLIAQICRQLDSERVFGVR